MRYDCISASLFVKNRAKLCDKLPSASAAILTSNLVLPTNGDGVMGFKQNSNLFYLTGIDQEETSLFIFPDHPNKEFREVLFIRKTSEHLKIWEGEKLSKQQASEISGIKNVLWSENLDTFLKRQLSIAENIFLDHNEGGFVSPSFVAASELLINKLKTGFPLHSFNRLAPILAKLRMIKEEEEIKLIQKAIEITHSGFLKLVASLKGGVEEFKLEAELTYDFLKNHSRGHAFQPIVASGASACVLHYITNDNTCKDGDVVLLDFGAEYANYNADISRCLPVNGKFSNRQKEVYTAVKNVYDFAIERMIPGNTFDSLKKAVHECMKEQLKALGLVNTANEEKVVQQYFPHGISHFLGLDVHDVGDKYTFFEPNMVLTCEPGIYIPEEGIGIRLENDILITKSGNRNLSEIIPIELDDIENLMS